MCTRPPGGAAFALAWWPCAFGSASAAPAPIPSGTQSRASGSCNYPTAPRPALPKRHCLCAPTSITPADSPGHRTPASGPPAAASFPAPVQTPEPDCAASPASLAHRRAAAAPCWPHSPQTPSWRPTASFSSPASGPSRRHRHHRLARPPAARIAPRRLCCPHRGAAH